MFTRNKKIAVELHSHLGAAVSPAILWSIAHRQGIKLPSKNYWDFEDMVTMTGAEKNKNLDNMHNNFYHWTELIQSSPEAIEESVKTTISGAYRKSNITVHEVRFNPMFRNRSGERDLDHIIMAALWGTQKAVLEYPSIKAGIILMTDRTLTHGQNEIIINKAIKYKNQGVLGVDVAGPERKTFSIEKQAELFAKARKAGLGITVHTGEAGSLDEMHYVVEKIRPERIGHGIKAVHDKDLMKKLVKYKITLEVCPTSNLRNSVLKNVGEVKNVIRTLLKNKVKFAICTDGPEMYQTSIYQEHSFLLENKIMTQKELDQSTKNALKATFIK
jgi:adenosine deaminase